jgi:serine/threonine protein kinase
VVVKTFDSAQKYEREKEALRLLQKESWVPLLMVTPSKSTQEVVMEYVEGQTLFALTSYMHWPEFKDFWGPLDAQMQTILRSLYALGFVHRDLDWKNVLLPADGLLTVIDFELCMRHNDVRTWDAMRGPVDPETHFDAIYFYFALALLPLRYDSQNWEEKAVAYARQKVMACFGALSAGDEEFLQSSKTRAAYWFPRINEENQVAF